MRQICSRRPLVISGKQLYWINASNYIVYSLLSFILQKKSLVLNISSKIGPCDQVVVTIPCWAKNSIKPTGPYGYDAILRTGYLFYLPPFFSDIRNYVRKYLLRIDWGCVLMVTDFIQGFPAQWSPIFKRVVVILYFSYHMYYLNTMSHSLKFSFFMKI